MNGQGMPTNPDGARRRVFVVSRDPLLRERLYDLLTGHGYAVMTITSGEVGLELLKHERPALILANSLDYHFGGITLADRVRTFDDKLPIVLLSHIDQQPLDTKTIREIQACLPSDAPEETLLATLGRWLTPPRSVTPIEFPGAILVVDDEPELSRNLEEFLEPRGCVVVTATSGEEALTQLVYSHPTVVLLDIKMPGMDGLVALKKIRETQPDLPVIIATALEDRELMAQAFMLGAYEYITKPYNLKELEDILLYLKKCQPKPGASPAQ